MPSEENRTAQNTTNRRLLFALSAILAIVTMIFTFLLLPQEQQYIILDATPPTAVPTPLAGEPFHDSMLGIVIANTVDSIDVHSKTIADVVRDKHPHILHLDHTIASTNEAHFVSTVYNARMAIWGLQNSRGIHLTIISNGFDADVPTEFDFSISHLLNVEVGGQFLTGILDYLNGQPTDALTTFDQMLVSMPQSIRDNSNIRMIHWFRGLSLTELGNYAEAIEAWVTYIEHSPFDPLAYYHRSTAYREAGFYPLAIQDLEQAIAIDENLSVAYTGLGDVAWAQGNSNRALEQYERAIELDADFQAPYEQVATIYIEQGDYDRAVAAYESVLKFDPGNADVYRELAELNIKLQQTDTALLYYGYAIELAPEDYTLYLQRGVFNRDVGNLDDALSDLNTAIEYETSDEALWFERGRLHYAMGQLDAALADYEQVSNLNKDYAPLYRERGRIYQEHELYTQSLESLNQSLLLNPEDSDARLIRGLTHYALEHYTLAIVDFLEVIRLDPGNPWGYYHNGNGYLQFEDMDVALQQYSLAIEIDSSVPDFYIARGMLYANYLNDETSARADFEQAIGLYEDDDIPEALQSALDALNR